MKKVINADENKLFQKITSQFQEFVNLQLYFQRKALLKNLHISAIIINYYKHCIILFQQKKLMLEIVNISVTINIEHRIRFTNHEAVFVGNNFYYSRQVRKLLPFAKFIYVLEL